MNTLNPRSHSGRDWLLLALLELSSAANDALTVGEQLESLLADTLQPLALPPDFTCKVLASACDAVTHIPQGVSLTRLLVFTPAPHPAHGQTWGFFRTIKNGEPSDSTAGSKYEIALYLYVESPVTPA